MSPPATCALFRLNDASVLDPSSSTVASPRMGKKSASVSIPFPLTVTLFAARLA